MAARTAGERIKVPHEGYLGSRGDDGPIWQGESQKPRRARATWMARLRTLAIIILTLAGVVVTVRGGSLVLDEFLRRRAAVYSGAAIPFVAEARVRPRTDARATASLPPFDEFAIRAAVRRVPAPADTGLPNIEWVSVEPERLSPLTVHLVVEGVDNAAWQGLEDDARQSYADEMVAALAAMYPQVETTKRWSAAYYMVKIHERFLIDTADVAGLDEEIRCIRAHSGEGLSECRRISALALFEVPTRQPG